MVIDPVVFIKEIEGLEIQYRYLFTSFDFRKAHLILPTHRLLDAASEAAKGKLKLVQHLKVSDQHMDKTGRNGIRVVGDIELVDFKSATAT